MFARASSWNWYSLPVRFATSPVHRSLASTPKVTPLRAQDVEERPQRLLEVGLEGARAAQPHEVLVLRRVEDLERRPTARTSAAGRRRGPRCCRAARGGCRPRRARPGASPFDTRPRRAPMMSGRCSTPTGHWFSHAPHVVHCHSTLGVEDVGQLRVEPCRRAARPRSAGSSVFGLSSLPVRVRRAVHLAAPALDARERVEHLLALDVLHASRGRPAPARSRGSAPCRGRATAGRPSAATARGGSASSPGSAPGTPG